MTDTQLYLTRADYQRLNDVLRATLLERREDLGDLTRLQDEIKRARIVEQAEIPGDVITMNSRVRLRDLDSGEQMEISLVYPSASDPTAKKISILAPIGTAILGYRKRRHGRMAGAGGDARLKIETCSISRKPRETSRSDTSNGRVPANHRRLLGGRSTLRPVPTGSGFQAGRRRQPVSRGRGLDSRKRGSRSVIAAER